MDKIKAVMLKKDENAVEYFEDVEIVKPELIASRDLLVEVQAISVNPVDTKIHLNEKEQERLLGWDAVGIIRGRGKNVKLFNVGDEVYYAGSIIRSGSNSQFQLVDERIVGKKPQTLTIEDAAAIPLTALTAWEALVDRLGISEYTDNKGKSILIINGAGGVGSMAIQLAKLSGLYVIATAAREESVKWVADLGADKIIDHHQPLEKGLKKIKHPEVDYILCLYNTDMYWNAICEVIKPEGKICSVVETQQPVNLEKLKDKSVSFSWEFMFTRAKYETKDMLKQHKALMRVAELYDQNQLKGTKTKTLKPINAMNLTTAHQLIKSGKMVGKIVLSQWE